MENQRTSESHQNYSVAARLAMRLSIFVTVLTFSASAVFGQADRESRLISAEVPIPRIEAAATIDGFLNEPVWDRAQVLRGFSQYSPVDGRLSQDSTTVLVWYAPTGIHFGVRAYEVHDDVRATLADRDKISSDDHVMVVLDTFNDRRQAVAIGVNALGSQADGTISDANSRSSSSSASEFYSIDLSPDYVYESAGRLTNYGYEIEIFIPFKSLRYQTEREQIWGLNVTRSVKHSGYSHSWAPVLRSNASFLSQSGTLTGLTDLRRGLVLDLNPEFTNSVSGSRVNDKWEYGNPEFDVDNFGANVRWGATNNLTVNASFNPDFSQVEADVAQNVDDPRRALFFPEKRPFFLDGQEFFSMPSRLVYTRRLTQPISAVKMTGKMSGTSIGVLSGVDKKSTSITGDDYRLLNAVRVKKDVFGQSSIGMAYTNKIDGDLTNQVGSVDGRFVIADAYTFTFQGAGSFTDFGDGQGTQFAPLWSTSFNKAGRNFRFSSSLSGTHGEFDAGTGFINRSDVVNFRFTPTWTWYPESGSLVESFSFRAGQSHTWTYGRFTEGNEPDDWRFHPGVSMVLKGGWSIFLSYLLESFLYADYLYDDYYVERHEDGVPVDTVAFTGTNRIKNYDLSYRISTPSYDKFSASLNGYYGRDVNYYEWAPAEILFFTLTTNWNPTDQLRFSLRYNHQQTIRPGIGSNISISRIPRLKVEYQLTQALFLRLVTQYNSFMVDALRDNTRTEDPILIRNSDGTFRRPQAFRRNNLTVDWLFSYRPVPGTVVFFGYGTNLAEPETYRFRNLSRVSDGFFMKLSYLFRV